MTRATETEERLRDLVREANAATKDLRSAIRDARAAGDEVDRQLRRTARDMIEKAVATGLAELGTVTEEAMDRAVAKVAREFERLERLFLHGPNRNDPTLEDLVRERRIGPPYSPRPSARPPTPPPGAPPGGAS